MAARLRCFISDVEYIMTDKYSIREQAGQIATASIDIRIDDQDIPVSHQYLKITDADENIIYSGLIQQVVSPQWSSTYEVYICKLSVKSLEIIFKNRIVTDSISNSYVHEIVDYLFDEYLEEEGLTKGTISESDIYYEKYISSGLTLEAVFEELGNASGSIARASKDKVFTFRSSTDLPSSTPPTHIKSLKKTESGKDLATVQQLSGASEETSLITSNFIWLDDQEVMTLPYQVSEVSGITINGDPATVGVLGVADDNVNITFLQKYGKNTISLNKNATIKPAEDDLVVVVYYGFYDIAITVENEDLKSEIAALSGTSGKIEKLKIETSITNYEDGVTLANSLISQYNAREETVEVEYNSSDLIESEILTSWDLQYPDLNIQGVYIITERTITDFYKETNVKLKLKNKNFYSRYGTVLDKNDKAVNNLTVRTDIVVVKDTVDKEIVKMLEVYTFESAGVLFYPVSGIGGDLTDPALPGFYPV